MTKKRSQTSMLAHSRAKVRLLEKYLEKYLNIIANDGHTERINIFDLFCGEGVYENNGEGSPIAILKVINDLHFINKARNRKIPRIDLVFNDKDVFKIEKLGNIIDDRKLHQEKFGKISFRSKDYKEIVQNLSDYINSFRNEKAFIFIDPYQYKEIRASEIKKLLASRKSEVLLFLPTQFMYRFDEKGTPEALVEILEELVDLKDWKSNSSVYNFIDQFKEALKQYLGSDFFVDTFTIEKDASTVYCLFFFSSHIRGFEKMLETKWQIDDDEGKGWSYDASGNLFSAFKTNQLQNKLVSKIKSEGKIYNGNVYEFTLRNGFLPTHTVEVFSSLQLAGKLEVGSDGADKVRKGAYYINYENYRESPKKVYFQIK